ncbi:MAG: ethanolamine utilization protein EutH [Bacillota bacterium]
MINQFIITILILFMIIGALDKIFGNKYGYGKAFEKGYQVMGSLSLAMIGAISVSPVLANLLFPIIKPIYNFIGADPGMFPPSILAIDMGGYTMAKSITSDPNIHIFGGLIIGSMLGTTIIFTIPIALNIIEKKDLKYFSKGIIIGISTLPIGALLGGLIAGINIKLLIINLIPIILFSTFVSIGLIYFTKFILNSFYYLSKFIFGGIILVLLIGSIQTYTDIVIINNLLPLEKGFLIVGKIAIILSGAFPLIFFIENHFEKSLISFGKKMNINKETTVGILGSLANNIVALEKLKDMNPKGKILCTSFLVSGSFTFGGQLGFIANIDSKYIFPVIIAKLTNGILSILLTHFLISKNILSK